MDPITLSEKVALVILGRLNDWQTFVLALVIAVGLLAVPSPVSKLRDLIMGLFKKKGR